MHFVLGRAQSSVDIRRVPQLLDTLASELERPRRVTAQVADHIIGTYGVARDEVGAFLANQLSEREEYEIDLILSPLFTPTLKDQAVVAELLGRDSFPADQWPGLVQQLAARPTGATLVTEDEANHVVPLRDVTIERFVFRLRLDATIPESLFKLLTHLPPASDRPMLKAIARRAVWENDARREIFVRFLTIATSNDSYRLDDTVELLKLAETYEPADTADLLARIPHWQQVLQQEINATTSPKPFFNERVQEMHGGGRDQRRQNNSIVTAKENERAFLERLQRVLAG
jgi:hypothetical protein